MTPEQLDPELVGAVNEILEGGPPMTREVLLEKLGEEGHDVSDSELDKVLQHCRDTGDVRRFPSSVYTA